MVNNQHKNFYTLDQMNIIIRCREKNPVLDIFKALFSRSVVCTTVMRVSLGLLV
jgi:hypothetical protein